jgi:hypothetical protein
MTEQVMNLSKYDGDGYEDVVVTLKQTRKIGKRRYFPSNTQNSFIVNAETGVKYDYRVGSFESRRLFKMVDSTGACDSEGFVMDPRDDTYPNRNPNHIFYDSPEQFARHQRTAIEPHFIENFNKRKAELFTSLPE